MSWLIRKLTKIPFGYNLFFFCNIEIYTLPLLFSPNFFIGRQSMCILRVHNVFLEYNLLQPIEHTYLSFSECQF